MQPPFVTERALANTYASHSYKTAYDRVLLYRKVQRATTRNPNKGSQALATQLGVSRNAIREWVDGDAVPEPVQAIQTADRRGWLAIDHADAAFAHLNRLVAWVFSGGRSTPSAGCRCSSRGPTPTLPTCATRSTRSASAPRPSATTRGCVYGDPAGRDAAVLGRVLSVLGAPVGAKADADLALPRYLDAAPERVRQDFVDVYLANRGQRHPDKATMTLRETRSRRYLDSLAALLRDVSGESVTVSEQNVVLSADATRALYGRLGATA